MFIKRATFAACAFFGFSIAQAAVISTPQLNVTAGVTGVSMWNGSPTGDDNGDGTFSYTGSQSTAMWDLSWDMVVNPDPFISAVFSFTNNTALTQTFFVEVSLPIAPPIPGPTVMGGSIGVTITDSNFNGIATVASVPTVDVYNGKLDGVAVLPLLTDPFSLSAPFAGGSATTSDVAGLPGPTIPGPPALATIGIRHEFTLTPGDSIGITSFFVVEAVPEASTIVMCGIASTIATVGAFVRRRRLNG